jgi:hypothetical protein
MADVVINKFTTQILRDGATPSSPGFVVSEGQDPVNPPGTNNFVPYSGATGTVDLGAQTIEAGSFIKDGGTSSQFLKADGSVDSTAYGTGSVTSVALSMPSAFSVAGSPITTAGTLAVTGAGTVGQYIRGDGSLATFPALTGFVPYTGATADVNLGTHDLAAERGTFTNNGSSDALTVNQTSGSGYGIIVTKGGANEALYVSKTSGSGNAMTVVGGRTSLVDLALSSVTNTAGDFLTLSGGVVHKRTAAETLTDIGGQAALTNPVTGTGTTNYLPKFTGASTIGNSNLINDSSGNLGLGVTPSAWFSGVTALQFGSAGALWSNSDRANLASNVFVDAATNTKYIVNGFALRYAQESGQHAWSVAPSGTAGNVISFTQAMTLFSTGNLGIGVGGTDSGFKLDVNGTGRFSDNVSITKATSIFQLGNSTNNSYGAVQFLGNATGNGNTLGELDFFNKVTGVNTLSAQIEVIHEGTSGDNKSRMFFRTHNGTSLITPLTISSTGAATFSGTGNGIPLIIQDISAAITGQTAGYIGLSTSAFSGNNGDLVLYPRTSAASKILLMGGNVLIGTTTDSGENLQVKNGRSLFQLPSGTNGAILKLGRSAGAYYWHLGISGATSNFEFYDNSLNVLANINVSTGAYTAVSDKNKKKDFEQSILGLNEIVNLKPTLYRMKNDSEYTQKQLGFIAQEVKEYIPQAYVESQDFIGLNYNSIIPVLVNAIKELKQEIDTLKNN